MQHNSMTVIGYVRVSTAEQSNSGAGLAAQRAAIAAECDRRGWQIAELIEDAGFSARTLKRPGMERVLTLLHAEAASGLVVAKLDRLSRSMLDFATVMELARQDGWAIVALDCAVDTTTPAGEAMANVMATFAQFERRLIGQRTKEALAVKRAAGVQLGRPAEVPAATADRIVRYRSQGLTIREIAAQLTSEQIPTARGGQWQPATISRVLRRMDQVPESAFR